MSKPIKSPKPRPVVMPLIPPPPVAPPNNPSTLNASNIYSKLSRKTTIKMKENDEEREYEINFDDLKEESFLGRGQFGTVKKMYHPPSNLTFAVKMICDADYFSNEPTQFMDLEAPKKFGDDCPYLIKFYGALHADSYIWILTEVMDTSLDKFYVKAFALKKNIPELFISKLAYAVLNAVSHMKQKRVMHRDIKPSNILLNATGETKICDFGISGIMTNSFLKSVKGCQRYMPPEKIDPSLSENGYTIKADIWSLGISLIEIVTGEHPFEKAVGYLAIIKMVMEDDPPRLDSSKFSEEFCSFVSKCLNKKAEDRADCNVLLNEPFIKKYEQEKIDLGFLREIIDEIKKDKLEG